MALRNAYQEPHLHTDMGDLEAVIKAALEELGVWARRQGVPALDNVFCERLWRSVKYGNIYLNQYDTVRQFQTGLNAYFDFYNHARPHQVSTIAHQRKSTSCSDFGRPYPSEYTLLFPFRGPKHWGSP